MPGTGLEPARLAAHGPKPCASANSAIRAHMHCTPARRLQIHVRRCGMPSALSLLALPAQSPSRNVIGRPDSASFQSVKKLVCSFLARPPVSRRRLFAILVGASRSYSRKPPHAIGIPSPDTFVSRSHCQPPSSPPTGFTSWPSYRLAFCSCKVALFAGLLTDTPANTAGAQRANTPIVIRTYFETHFEIWFKTHLDMQHSPGVDSVSDYSTWCETSL